MGIKREIGYEFKDWLDDAREYRMAYRKIDLLDRNNRYLVAAKFKAERDLDVLKIQNQINCVCGYRC